MAEKEAWSTNTISVNKLGYPCLTYSKALEYISTGFSCLFEVEKQRQVGLPPRYIGQIDDGIRETLDADLLRYSEDLSGIIVCYKHVQCLDKSGCIIDETPFLYFDISVKYIIFRPQVGEKLEGVVNKVGHGHYGCIVHKCFNASVHKIQTDPSKQTKRQLKNISNIDIGSEVVFRITRFDIHNDVLSIKGKIENEDFTKIRNIKREKSTINDASHTFVKEEKEEMIPEQKKKKQKNSMVNGEGKALIGSVSHQLSLATPGSEIRIKEEQESHDEKTKDQAKSKKSKRKHSEISQSIKVENKTNRLDGDNDSPLPVKKRKKSKIE